MSTNLHVYCEIFSLEVCFLSCQEIGKYEGWKISNCIIFILYLVENLPSVRDLWEEQHEHTQTYGMILADLRSRVLSTGCPETNKAKCSILLKKLNTLVLCSFSTVYCITLSHWVWLKCPPSRFPKTFPKLASQIHLMLHKLAFTHVILLYLTYMGLSG